MNTSTEHIPQCNQSEPLAGASGKIVDLMNENGSAVYAVSIENRPKNGELIIVRGLKN